MASEVAFKAVSASMNIIADALHPAQPYKSMGVTPGIGCSSQCAPSCFSVLYVGGYSNTNSSNAPNYGLSYANANNVLGIAYTTVGGRLAFVFDADSASSTPTVTYDHSFLAEQGIDTSSLTDGITITDGTTTYTDMGVVGGFKHVGWMVDGNTYTTTNVVVSTDSHTAVSVWVHVLSFRSDPVSEGIFAFSKYA